MTPCGLLCITHLIVLSNSVWDHPVSRESLSWFKAKRFHWTSCYSNKDLLVLCVLNLSKERRNTGFSEKLQLLDYFCKGTVSHRDVPHSSPFCPTLRLHFRTIFSPDDQLESNEKKVTLNYPSKHTLRKLSSSPSAFDGNSSLEDWDLRLGNEAWGFSEALSNLHRANGFQWEVHCCFCLSAIHRPKANYPRMNTFGSWFPICRKAVKIQSKKHL